MFHRQVEGFPTLIQSPERGSYDRDEGRSGINAPEGERIASNVCSVGVAPARGTKPSMDVGCPRRPLYASLFVPHWLVSKAAGHSVGSGWLFNEHQLSKYNGRALSRV